MNCEDDNIMKTKALSMSQKEILNFEQYYENTSVNNIVGVAHLGLSFDYEEINNALNELIRKNDSHRLRITIENGEYKQYLNKYQKQNFSYIDFYKDKINYETWLYEETNLNTFAYDDDLFKFVILKFPEGGLGLFSLQHHVIADGWSMTLFMDFLTKQLTKEIVCDLPNSSYIETIENELKYTNSKRFQKDERFWSGKLRELNNNTPLKKTKLDNGSSRRNSFKLSNLETKRVDYFCKYNEASISNLFSCIMLIIIYKKSLYNINSVGLLIHNRHSNSEKYTTGNYTKALPVIVKTDKELSIREYLDRVKVETFNILKHRKYPYNNIFRDNSNGNGLLDCLISYHNTQYNSAFLKNGFSEKWINTDTLHTPLRINISNRSSEEGYIIDYDYQNSILNESEIYTLHQNILRVLFIMLTDSEQKIDEIDLI